MPLEVSDETIWVRTRAMERARLGRGDKLAAIRRLDAEARRIERAAGATARSADALTAASRAAPAPS